MSRTSEQGLCSTVKSQLWHLHTARYRAGTRFGRERQHVTSRSQIYQLVLGLRNPSKRCTMFQNIGSGANTWQAAGSVRRGSDINPECPCALLTTGMHYEQSQMILSTQLTNGLSDAGVHFQAWFFKNIPLNNCIPWQMPQASSKGTSN